MPAAMVAVLKITLDDVAPQVMRRVVVPSNLRLDRLHLVIQAVMGWTNSHLYEIRIGDVGWGEPDPDGFYDGPLDAKTAKLASTLADAGRKTFKYIYDFGDGWDHTIKVEKIAPDIAGPTYLLLDAVGRCPPEDCGGPPGYERLLKTLADPDDEEHDDLLVWAGGPIDPRSVDIKALERDLERLAKRWAPRSRGEWVRST
jgi:hypothetical protein